MISVASWRLFRRHWLIGLVAGFSIVVTAPMDAHAQADAATSVLQQAEEEAQEIDRRTTPRQTGSPVIADDIERPDLPPAGGPTLLLNGVRFEPPSAFLTDEELQAIASRYVGTRVDFSLIASLVRDVNDLYAEKGIITASAILPQQELADGILLVQLVEGRVGAVGLLGERRTRDEVILRKVQLTRGDGVVDVPAAADDIARFNATHRAQLRMLLQPGAAFGLTDIVLGVTEPPPDLFQFFMDNEGVESTGEMRLNALYRKYGALGIDDSLMLYLSGSPGSIAGTITYDQPITDEGTRISLGYTVSGIHVVAGPTAVLDVYGASQAGTVTLTHPLFVDPEWTVQALASASYGVNSSEVSGVTIVDSDTTKLAAGIVIGHTGASGSFTIQPQAIYAGTNNRLVPGEHRDILLFAGSAIGTYKLDEQFSLVGRGSWQYTDAQLLPGDLLFQIGGPKTVRGYPSSGVAGDSGYFGQVELHWSGAPDDGPEPFLFGDFGQVFSTFPSQQTLLSAGAGLIYRLDENVTLDGTFAVPLLDSMPGQSWAAYWKLAATIQ